MGEMSDWMLNGKACEACGAYMGKACGYPRICAGCQDEDRRAQARAQKGLPTTKVKCRQCGKYVKPAGLAMHCRDVHGSEQAAGIDAEGSLDHFNRYQAGDR